MILDTCDHCHQPADELISVKTCEATFWDPAEWELICRECLELEEAYEARRDAALEKQWEERTGR